VTTTATEPAAPVAMPPRPEKAAAKSPITAVVCRPTIGLTPATKAKATASGIIASDTVKPERIFWMDSAPVLVRGAKNSALEFATRSSVCEISAADGVVAAAWKRGVLARWAFVREPRRTPPCTKGAAGRRRAALGTERMSERKQVASRHMLEVC
jgi:hypothetical protein